MAAGRRRAHRSASTDRPAARRRWPATARVKQQISAALAERGVRVLQQRCAAVQANALLLDDGTLLRCDAAVLATGSDAPRWLADSGLALEAPVMATRSA